MSSSKKIFDTIIAGAGPAGMTAAIYAARKKMDFLLLTKEVGGQVSWSGNIENYMGYQFVSGMELVDKFEEHLKDFNVEIRTDEPVTLMEKIDERIYVKTDKGEYYAKTAIAATGRLPRPLEAEGEKEFLNRGVTYCATCDGPLFEGLEVSVIGGGNSAFDAVLQLTKIAKKIYVIEIEERVIADPIMVEKALNSGKVKIITNARVKKIFGENLVKGITIIKDNKETNLAVEGVFIEIGSVPASSMVPQVNKNRIGEIIVDCGCRTSEGGILAAGDVTTVPAKQIIVACGEGAKALLTSFDYINTHWKD